MSFIGNLYEEKVGVESGIGGSAMNIPVKDTTFTCPYCQSIFKEKVKCQNISIEFVLVVDLLKVMCDDGKSLT